MIQGIKHQCIPAYGVSSSRQSTGSVRFSGGWFRRAAKPAGGNKDNQEAQTLKTLTEFQPPYPRPLVQRAMLSLNSNLLVRFYRHLTPVFAKEDIKRLRDIPKNAGNILAGTHPDVNDAFVTLHLYKVGKRRPAGFFMATEGIVGQSKLVQRLCSWMGAIPIARGKKNDEAVNFMTQQIADGGWGHILPEGEIYHSRVVQPMEYGTMRTAVEAALRVQEESRMKGIPEVRWRPILVTPFSHVYLHDPKAMQKSMEKFLAQLEAHPQIFGEARTGNLFKRIENVGQRLMVSRAERYGVPTELVAGKSPFDAMKGLRTRMIEDLEKKYMGQVDEGFERRRAHKVKIKIYEKQKDPSLTEAQRAELKLDLDKTHDIVYMTPFDRAYLAKFDDLETWGEMLKRYRAMMRCGETEYGKARVVCKVHPPINIHPIAKQYKAITNPEAQMQFLFDRTEELRQTVQKGIDAICKENRVPTVSTGDNPTVQV